MKLWGFIVFALLLLNTGGQCNPSVISAVKSVYDSRVSASVQVDLGCLIKHCTLPTIECTLSITGCDKAISCASKCLEEWDEDKTPEKIHVQNCTTKCADSAYGNKPYYKFMECLSDHSCVSFPPIPNECRAPAVYPVKNLTTKAIDGAWWVVRGYHPIYDCYPCQHLLFTPINSSYFSYKTTYDAYTSEGDMIQVTQTTPMPLSAPGGNITFTYHDVGGLFHHETWWLIDSADDGSYIQTYYCGSTTQWYYDGALVLARNRTLSAADYVKIADSYEKGVGLNLKDFCYVKAQNCSD